MVDIYLGTDLDAALVIAAQEMINDSTATEWTLSIGEQLSPQDEALIMSKGFMVKAKQLMTVGEAPIETFWLYTLVNLA